MATTRFSTKLKRFIRRGVWRRRVVVCAALILFVAVVGYMMERTSMNIRYDDLLETIARGESKGNYNAYFGNTANSEIDFTAMTVGEVLEWQQAFVAEGQPSNAVGKYQFIQPTLAGLIHELDVGLDTKFDAILQDKLAVRLIQRRGVVDYMRGYITREQFAHNLSKEWAALPRVIGDNPSASYYAGDGLNAAHVGVDEVLVAIERLRGSEPAS